MWANFDQYTPPNRTMFEKINNIKNRPLKAEPDPWVIDHNNAVDGDANKANTNKSAKVERVQLKKYCKRCKWVRKSRRKNKTEC